MSTSAELTGTWLTRVTANDDSARVASAKLDLVRSIFAAWERGDFSSAEWAHPGIEVVVVEGPSPGSWTGLAGMAAAWREFLSAWEDYRNLAEEYRELDDERVLVLFHASGREKTSGLELGQMQTKGGTCLFHVRSGRVTRLVVYYEFPDLGLGWAGRLSRARDELVVGGQRRASVVSQ